jgi:transcriptional regulator with XRE-family HTH domain
MTVSLEETIARESEESQLRIKQMTANLIAEELNLRELRRARKPTQARLSKKLKIGQEGVSRIEKRSDLDLSTLRSYVEAVGGELTLMVKFPDRPPVILAGLGENTDEKQTKNRRKTTAKSKPKSKPATLRATGAAAALLRARKNSDKI